jgi:hypothetical protein
MAVIVREEKIIGGEKFLLPVYKLKPGRILTADDKKQAEKLDAFLKKKVKQIEREVKETDLLALKGRKGKVHKLWYVIGKRLEFVEDQSIVSTEDRDFVWRAIYDHAADIAPGPITERALRDPETSHFSYCFKISRFPWKFVEMAGDWTSWSEFFDRKETKNDPRIIQWLGEAASKNKIAGRQNWLRPITKAIHKEFNMKDTTVFSDSELYSKLDKILASLQNNKRDGM